MASLEFNESIVDLRVVHDWVVIVHKNKIVPLNFKEDLTQPQAEKNIETKVDLKRGVWDVYATESEIKIVVPAPDQKGHALITTISYGDKSSVEKQPLDVTGDKYDYQLIKFAASSDLLLVANNNGT